MSPTRNALAVWIALLLSVTALAAPARAEVEVIQDKTGDGSNGTGPGGPKKFGDIGSVRVKHGTARVRLAARPAEHGQLADFYDFWVDTDPTNPGPEFNVSVSLEVLPQKGWGPAGVTRADTFGDLGGETTCSGDQARIKRKGIRVRFGRPCFDTPDRLRVSLQTSMEYEVADWAPRRKHFGAWVTSG